MQATYTCMFGGEAGYGVMSAGAMVAKATMRNGLWSMVVNEYPSLIKGGLNTCLVRVAQEPLTAYEDALDFLGAVSQPAFDLNVGKVKSGGMVLYDAKLVKPDPQLVPQGVKLFPVSILEFLTSDAAKVMSNSALLGAFCALTGFPKTLMEDVLKSEFKKEHIREQNLAIFDKTYDAMAATGQLRAEFVLPLQAVTEERMLINGNEAIAMGAIQAGCKFSAGYPMTPGSSVLMYLAEHGPQYGVVFKQAEDEIAAINMLIGAAFTGVRALGSTSGGGFALMVEALGFAAQAEVPLVMVNAQRGGPSTGQPTRTAQADLNFVLHSSQGEFPRFVVAPGDVEECFYETFRVFNLVEEFQVPAIILTDKYLADTSLVTPFFKANELNIERGKLADAAHLADKQPYLRYAITDDGVSPRAFPGQSGGRHIATSYTHGEDGFYSSGNHEYAGQEPEITVAMLDKWYRKVPLMEQKANGITLHGPAEADVTVIAWGSTKGAILEAMSLAEANGISVNFLQVRYIAPFPTEAVEAVMQKVKRTLLVEGNKTAQLGGILRAHTGHKPDAYYLKYDSRPFVPSGILAKIKEVLS